MTIPSSPTEGNGSRPTLPTLGDLLLMPLVDALRREGQRRRDLGLVLMRPCWAALQAKYGCCGGNGDGCCEEDA